MSRKQVVLLIGSLAALAAAGGTCADDDGQVVERGAFRLHLYKKPTGRETYEIRRDGDGMVLKEIAPGIAVDEVKATTGCNLIIPAEVPPVRLRG